MIPKKAWIHWAEDGPSMSWLREAGVRSFKNQNPGWECNVIGSIPESRNRGLMWCQEADWTWWDVLSRFGGFLVASDVIHVKPMPAEWLDADICAQERKGKVYQFAALGAVPGCKLMEDAAAASSARAAPGLDFQAFGVHLLKSACRDVRKDYGRFASMPERAFCRYGFTEDVDLLWSDAPGDFKLDDDIIGVHWYGGHHATKARERSACLHGKSIIERIAREAI